MKKTGEVLKQKRESSNLTLSEVALATKINPKILAAIENGEEEHLPAKIFLKGFVRSYALFLKMDPEEVMRVYHEEHGAPEKPVEVVREEAATGTSRRRSHEENSSGMRTLAVVVIVLLMGVIIGVRELVEKYQAEKVVEAPTDLKVSPIVTPPESEVRARAQAEKDSEASAARASAAEEGAPAAAEATAEPGDADATTTETTTTATAPEAPAASTSALATPAAPVATPTAPTVTTAPTAPTVTTPPTPAVTPAPAAPVAEPVAAQEEPKPEAPAPGDVKHEIILEALDQVEVKFKVHGESRKVSLGPTQVHTIQASEPVVLDLSDGGAVNIILNGRERGVPGDLGKPKQVKIP